MPFRGRTAHLASPRGLLARSRLNSGNPLGTAPISHQAETLRNLGRESFRRTIGIGLVLAGTPYRSRPGGIVLEPRDHMDVELGNGIADRADIEFRRLRRLLQRGRNGGNFL